MKRTLSLEASNRRAGISPSQMAEFLMSSRPNGKPYDQLKWQPVLRASCGFRGQILKVTLTFEEDDGTTEVFH